MASLPIVRPGSGTKLGGHRQISKRLFPHIERQLNQESDKHALILTGNVLKYEADIPRFSGIEKG